MSTKLESLVMAQFADEERRRIAAEEARRAEIAETRKDLTAALDEFLGSDVMDALAHAGLQHEPTHDGPSLLLRFTYGAQVFILTVRFRMNAQRTRRELEVRLALPNASYDPSNDDSRPYNDLGDVHGMEYLLSYLAPYTKPEAQA